MESGIDFTNVFPFKDQKPSIDPVLNYTENGKSGSVLVIDNGSYNCRMGWDTSGAFDISSLGTYTYFKYLIASGRCFIRQLKLYIEP